MSDNLRNNWLLPIVILILFSGLFTITLTAKKAVEAAGGPKGIAIEIGKTAKEVIQAVDEYKPNK